MDRMNYKFKINDENNFKKDISFRPEGYSFYIKAEEIYLGTDYTFENIENRINNKENDLGLEDVKTIKNNNSYENISTISNHLLILNKYGINSFKEINEEIEKRTGQMKQNNKMIDRYKEELKNLKLYPSINSSRDIYNLTIKINNAYNKNKFLNNEIKTLRKIQKNASIFMNYDYEKERKNENKNKSYEKH